MNDCRVPAPPPPMPPPAVEQGRPVSDHRYPPGRPSRQPDTEWTIGDALAWLDPQPHRRTLSRWLEGLEPVGRRRLPQGGPPARTYRAREIMEAHARWRPQSRANRLVPPASTG